MAYGRAVKRFFDWCEEFRAPAPRDRTDDAAYVEQLGGTVAKPTVK
jgi:hypothetical protein